MQNPLSSLTRRERAGLVILTSILVLLSIGSFFYRSTVTPLEPMAAPIASPKPSATVSPTPQPAPRELVVYVTGAVRSPGIYTLPAGSRLYQAVRKAGGFRRGAQQEALNLASFLKDADQVHIPTQGATLTALPPTNRTTSNPGAPQARPVVTANRKLQSPSEGQINLNTANLEELQRLPGVGPSIAQRILEYRQANGGFQEIVQLKEVRGIGEKTFGKLEPFLAL